MNFPELAFDPCPLDDPGMASIYLGNTLSDISQKALKIWRSCKNSVCQREWAWNEVIAELR
jgi:hypothetical protein